MAKGLNCKIVGIIWTPSFCKVSYKIIFVN